MKKYQAPTISVLFVDSEDIISTSGKLNLGGEGNIQDLSGIDFGNW